MLLGATAPLIACSALDGEPEATPPPPPHPDEAVRGRAAAAESKLIALYAAVAADHPSLAGELDPFRRRHEEHHAALLGVTIPAAVSPTRTPTGTPSASPGPPHPAVHADPGEALDELVAAEAEAAEARLADCLDARGRALATVLASIAAGEAAQERLVRRVEPS